MITSFWSWDMFFESWIIIFYLDLIQRPLGYALIDVIKRVISFWRSELVFNWLINALPIMAPDPNSHAVAKVALLEIPNPMRNGLFIFRPLSFLKYDSCSGLNSPFAPVVLEAETAYTNPVVASSI